MNCTIHIGCFFNDKYRLEYYTNENVEFICLYDIFDLNKYWIVKCQESYLNFISSGFIYRNLNNLNHGFDNIFNNNLYCNKYNFYQITDGYMVFNFFLLISNIYMNNLNYNMNIINDSDSDSSDDDDDDDNDNFRKIIRDFNKCRMYYSIDNNNI